MVEAAQNIIWEEQIRLINKVLKEEEDHIRVWSLMQELIKSVKANRCLTEAGEGITEKEKLYRDFMKSDIYKLEEFGVNEHDQFL